MAGTCTLTGAICSSKILVCTKDTLDGNCCRYVRKLVAIQAFGDFCVLATKVGDDVSLAHPCTPAMHSALVTVYRHHCEQ